MSFKQWMSVALNQLIIELDRFACNKGAKNTGLEPPQRDCLSGANHSANQFTPNKTILACDGMKAQIITDIYPGV